MRAFEVVYAAIVKGHIVTISGELLKEAIEVAARNKVLLQFLRVLGLRNELRWREEALYRRFLKVLREIVSVVDDCGASFVKLHKPVIYVPSDVDVLVYRDSLKALLSGLRALGFSVNVVEPYCVTLVRRGFVIDVYVDLALSNVIYIEGAQILKYRKYVVVGGLEVPTLAPCVEAIVSAAHAIYKERLYTLNDYITVNTWLAPSALSLAIELRCEDAIREALIINRLVETKRLILPYKVPVARWFLLWIFKIHQDPRSRGTLPNIIHMLEDPRFGRLFLSKFTRVTY